MGKSRFVMILFIFLLAIFIISLVDAGYSWVGNDINYSAFEDTIYYHNLTNNVTGTGANRVFSIDDTGGLKLLWNGEIVSSLLVSRWIYIANETTGDFVINATRNNETGIFRIPFKVSWEGSGGVIESFYFNVNATNDPPYFTNLVNRTMNIYSLFDYIIYTYDEENQTPYGFNITFLSCSLAPWSSRAPGNCTLFDNSPGRGNGTTFNISFTPQRDDVGYYIINFTVTDNGVPNMSTSEIINFTVLNVNAAPYFTYVCDNERTATEDTQFVCRINATDIDEINNLTFSSNVSWFIFNSSGTNQYSVNITDYNATAWINFTPTDYQVGNWMINISVRDSNIPFAIDSETFSFPVSNINDSVILDGISDLIAFTTNNYTIYVNASDNDLLIPDKTVYDEILTFSSNLTNVTISNMSTIGSKTLAKIEFNPNYLGDVNYVNISVRDRYNNSVDSTVFKITVSSNNAPVWNESIITNYSLTEDVPFYLNISGNVSDIDNNGINFSYSNETSFHSFSLNRTTGIINFTPEDADVGYHPIIIYASDNAISVPLSFNFTVTNVNDNLSIITPLLGNSITINITTSNMNATEDSAVAIFVYVQDNDFKIPENQKEYYNETINIGVSIQGVNNSLFNFTRVAGFPDASLGFPNETRFSAYFTPRKDSVGSYNVTLNVSDASNQSVTMMFNLTITPRNHAPEIGNLTNLTGRINSSFYYQINATDIEQGISGRENQNFTFTYSNLTEIYLFNSTTFNTTSGEINITFNYTQAGIHHINISVMDATGLNSSKDFWMYIYDVPLINYPLTTQQFVLQEYNQSNITFQANHSVMDNLTYYIYINDNLKYNLSYYGNSTNLTWQYTPNYTEETYGVSNLTLLVYSELYPELNSTGVWNITINHTNSPVNFTGHIGDASTTYGSTIKISLADYFSDADYLDAHYNQTVNFTKSSNGTSITASFSGWNLTFSSSIATMEIFTITASDLNDSNGTMTNAVSNAFTITFTTPATTPVIIPTPSGGGGGSSATKYHSIKIIVPGQIVISEEKYIDVPFIVKNTGQVELSGINLSSMVSYNDLYTDNVRISLANSYISGLSVGESVEMSMRIYTSSQRTGKYKATLYANITSPKFNDWADFYIQLEKINETEAEKLLIFTEKLISENPRCLELTELVKEAKKLFDEQDFEGAAEKSRQAIGACETAISSNEQIRYKGFVQDNFLYFISGIIAAMIVGIILYIYKRVRFNKVKGYDYV